nr:retrotransposon protein, putative, Ty1-copia subclass [Tanacetum cinerariifolium]
MPTNQEHVHLAWPLCSDLKVIPTHGKFGSLKLLKDLKELAEYDQSTNTDRPIFLNDNEDHPLQNKESPKNSPEENVVSKTNQEPLQDSDIHQLIEECSLEVPEQQKQKMEDTMFELVKICHHKQFLCIHDDIDNLIESALDSKLLLINSNSQRLDKNEQEVKNVIEQPVERRNRAEKSLQNFRVVHKSSISFKNTSQISSIHSIAPIESTKEPEHLLSMGYEHLSITPETESDEVTESNAENLLPIPSKCEVTLEDEIECDMPAKDVYSPVFTTFSNPFFKDNNDLDSSDDESLPVEDVSAEGFKIYSNPLCDKEEINSDKFESHCFNVESDFVESLLNRNTFIDFSSKIDFSGELAYIKPEIPKSNFDFEEEIRLIENLPYDNSFPRPPEELNAEIADTIIESIPLLPIPVQDGNSQQEEIDIVTETDDVLPPSVEYDNDDSDLLLEEVDLFLFDDSIPPGIENVADDPEGDVYFLEELLIDDSILSHESFDSSFEDNPSISRPPPEPPDDELDLEPDSGKDISAVVNKDASDDYCSLMFVIRFFLPYLILPEISPLLLSAESEDTIFDPVEAIREFHLRLLGGIVLILRNCHYAPSITRGIISVSRLYKDGFVNRFENDNSIYVSKNNLIYFNVILRDNIYEIVLSSSNTNDSSIKKRIEKLQHDGLLDSTDIKSFEKCVSCMSGKMTRKPYSHQVEKATDLLGLIHTDVCGLFKIMSRQGAYYFVTFTDEFSRYGYVYLLKHKHEVFETIKVFQKEVENQLGKTIKSLRSGRGGEYTIQEFSDHLKEHGIITHRTPPYTPQHNGYPKETMGYSFYYPPENIVFVAWNVEFFENDIIDQDASGSLEDLESFSHLKIPLILFSSQDTT